MNHEALKQARQNAGLSIAVAARRAGCSPSYLSELESSDRPCKPSAELLYDLSELYGVRLSWLIGKANRDGSPIMESPTPALLEMAREYELSDDDIAGLAQVSYRGRKPQTARDYWFIWYAAGLCLR